MAEFRISVRARNDLIGIYDYTYNEFGAYQAEAYYAGLIRTFGLIADFPRIGKATDALAKGVRRFRFQSHIVFYTCENDSVEIRAVIHQARDIRPELFD